MRVGKILGQKGTIYSIQSDSPISEAAKLMNEKQIGALMVLDADQNIAGIVSERDLLRKCATEKGDVRRALVEDIMTPKDKLITLSKDHDLRHVMRVMTENNIRHIPILDQGKLIGLISIRDVIKILLESAEFENKLIMEYMDSTALYI